MEYISEAKSARLLSLYARFLSGQVLHKAELAHEFGVTERSIQRDMESLRSFLADQGLAQDIVYDRTLRGYKLTDTAPKGLTNSEILAVCKILLESRSMIKAEMMPILDELIDCCVPEENKKAVQLLLANEKYHYIEPHHGKSILNGLWEIGQAIQNRQVMEIEYSRLKEPKLVTRTVEPVGIMFSEYYFYLTAFLRDVDRETEFDNSDDLFPTIYRIDRIKSFKILDEHFHVPYINRFEEGEFRRRVQFMFGGRLQKVRFQYSGPSVEAVLDRLPTAEIIEEQNGVFTIQAEVFGKGIDIWLRSQGDFIHMEGGQYEQGT